MYSCILPWKTVRGRFDKMGGGGVIWGIRKNEYCARSQSPQGGGS